MLDAIGIWLSAVWAAVWLTCLMLLLLVEFLCRALVVNALPLLIGLIAGIAIGMYVAPDPKPPEE